MDGLPCVSSIVIAMAISDEQVLDCIHDRVHYGTIRLRSPEFGAGVVSNARVYHMTHFPSVEQSNQLLQRALQ